MILVTTSVLSVLSGALLWMVFRTPLAAAKLCRPNFRGAVIPATAGVIVMAVGSCGSLVVLIVATHSVPVEVAFAGFQAAAGFGVLGLLDDLGGQAGGGGFRGHLRALRERRVTTGAVKMFGGGILALMVAGLITTGGVVPFLRDGAIIALAANLANLFDRAPARTTKVAVVAAVALVGATGAAAPSAIGLLGVGAAVGLAPWELREQLMQGDTGANVTGALLGIGAVATLGNVALWATAGVLLGLNLASERVSFSKVIDRTAPLRFIDRLGRPAP